MGAGVAESVAQALRSVVQGDDRAASELLPLVYEELRLLARAWLGRLPPGQTLQATALVHEAFMRVVRAGDPGWDGRRHFFGAAAQAMREILIEQARHKASVKAGGGRRRVDTGRLVLATEAPSDDLLALDDALNRLEQEDARAHQVVMLRFFTGLSVPEVAEMLGVSVPTTERSWRYARAWLHAQLSLGDGDGGEHEPGTGPARGGAV
jgi:RNA polymerase sigma factor (TIGR02999 family)